MFSTLFQHFCAVLRKNRRCESSRLCYTGRIATTIFNATHHFHIVATLFQHCYAVLGKKSSLRIVPCNITLKAWHILKLESRGKRRSIFDTFLILWCGRSETIQKRQYGHGIFDSFLVGKKVYFKVQWWIDQ